MNEHYVDTHCHLDRFSPDDRDAIILRAVSENVSELVTIGTRLSEAPLVRSIAAAAPKSAKVWCTIGTHPEYVEDEPDLTAQTIAELADWPEIIGIGETGLDYTVGISGREQQKLMFRKHIEAARLAAVPLVIHARGADEDIASILLEEQRSRPFRFVLHCFSSGERLASIGIDLGGYISFSGIITFKKSTELREIARSIPTDRMLIETDAPYLAPVPRRGHVNEPAFLPLTARVLASELARSPEEIMRLTSNNFRRLFDKAA